MADATMAESLRLRIEEQSGSSSLANRMVPPSANEANYKDTASKLEEAIRARTGLSSPFTADDSNLFELPDVGSVQSYFQSILNQLSEALPKMRDLLQQRAAQKMLVDLVLALGQRVAARSVKFVLAGPQVGASKS
jgi:hypothetical protein